MQRNRATLQRATAPARRKADIEAVIQATRLLLRGVNQVHRAAEQRWRVSSAQLLVLRILAEAPSSSVNDLAGLTATHQSTVSVVVARLVRRGLVRRRRAADDGRRTELALTQAGWGLYREAEAAEVRRMTTALAPLPGVRVRSLVDSLTQLGKALDGDGAPVGGTPGRNGHRRRAIKLVRGSATAR